MRRLNNINLVREINSGGTATIYFGINESTGFPVAVKELNPKLFRNPLLKAMFIAEANRYLYLDHPNIVKLEDLILLETEQTGYLVMEYIEGRNLAEHMKEVTGSLPFLNAGIFMIEALNAIGYAHESGFVHMDLKPSNIMLSVKNEIKVIDFGISVDLREKKNTEIMGTPYYMSPEQIEGSDVDHRTDIYSMGVTIYELITGRPPFADTKVSREKLLEMIKTIPLPQVKTNNFYDKPLLKQMNRIIQKATAKYPGERYQLCNEFIDDLAEIL